MIQMKHGITLSAVVLMAIYPSTTASPETLSACLAEINHVNESEEVSLAFSDMMTHYAESCLESNLCEYELGPELNAMAADLMDNGELDSTGMTEISAKAPKTLGEIPPIHGHITFDFGGDFLDHELVNSYDLACRDVGVNGVTRLTSQMEFKGDALSSFIDPTEGVGIDTDFQIYVKNYPMCLPAGCSDEEDLTKVMEAVVKSNGLKSPEVQEKLTPQIEAMVQALSVDQLCALSGLEKCDVNVSVAKSPAWRSSLGYGAAALSAVAFSWFL